MKYIILLMFIANATIGKAQQQIYSKVNRKKLFSVQLGYGAPSIVRTILRMKNEQHALTISGFGPIMCKVNYRIHKRVSIGLHGSYSFSKVTWYDDGYDPAIHKERPYIYGVKSYEISGLVRANYHFLQRKRIDAYVGAGIGYGKYKFEAFDEAPVNEFKIVYSLPRPISLEATVGLRYHFLSHWGIYSELGIGKSWLIFNKYFIPESILQGGIFYQYKLP